jgi:hypothetical protein
MNNSTVGMKMHHLPSTGICTQNNGGMPDTKELGSGLKENTKEKTKRIKQKANQINHALSMLRKGKHRTCKQDLL